MRRPDEAMAYDVALTDFDGTVIKEDIPLQVLRRFALPGWEAYDERLQSGLISLESCLRAQYAMIRAPSAAEILRFARGHYELREGFAEFAMKCRGKGVKLVLVSAGLDFCIRDVVGRHGLALDRLVCPKSRFDAGGIKVEFPAFRSPARNFKEGAVLEYRMAGKRCIYVGDGYSDLYPSSSADAVFAVRGSVLETECRKNGVAFSSFESFESVSELLE